MKLTKDACRRRRELLLERVQGDLILITNPRHILYFTGFWASELSLSGWGPKLLAIDPKGRATLVTHNFATGGLDDSAVDRREVWTWYDPSRTPGGAIWQSGADQVRQVIQGLLGTNSSPRICYESGTLPLDYLPEGITPAFVDISEAVLMQRRQKLDDEVALIRRAVSLTETGLSTARDVVRPGLTEMELYTAMLSAMTEEAGAPVNLISDVLSGPRCREGSGPPTGRTIEAGDSVILDLNPYIDGYRSDFTETLVLRDELSVGEQHAEKTLHEALAAAESLLKPGITAGSVYKAVDYVLKEAGFSEGLVHHAGHGIGLGHPEAPYFVAESEEVLMTGDVVTLEPGVYGEDAGARIEHNYLITPTGFKRLSEHDTSFLVGG
jgi:Xaa-Pro aminopeptidase